MVFDNGYYLLPNFNIILPLLSRRRRDIFTYHRQQDIIDFEKYYFVTNSNKLQIPPQGQPSVALLKIV